MWQRLTRGSEQQNHMSAMAHYCTGKEGALSPSKCLCLTLGSLEAEPEARILVQVIFLVRACSQEKGSERSRRGRGKCQYVSSAGD